MATGRNGLPGGTDFDVQAIVAVQLAVIRTEKQNILAGGVENVAVVSAADGSANATSPGPSDFSQSNTGLCADFTPARGR